MDKYNLYSIDMDYCPKYDNIIMKMQCSGCKYYKGFELYNAQPCIKCSYYYDLDDQNKD